MSIMRSELIDKYNKLPMEWFDFINLTFDSLTKELTYTSNVNTYSVLIKCGLANHNLHSSEIKCIHG